MYPVDIKGYLDKDTNTPVTKYSMIWEEKKLTSKKHTKWSAGCNVNKEDFEEKIKDCKDDNEKGELVEKRKEMVFCCQNCSDLP